MRYHQLFQSIMLVSIALFLFGCEDSQVKDLRARVESMKKTEHPDIQPKTETELTIPVSASYHPDAVRAPFLQSGTLTRGKDGALANPLLTYPLTMLRFVGTVSQGKTTYAFVATPDNLIYQIKQGDAIGDHEGRVVSVTADRLNIVEQTNEGGKSAEQRIVALQLRDEGE